MSKVAAPAVLQLDHCTTRGTIAYLSHQPDRYLQERGREYFHIDVHSDGKRTIIAHCEIDDRPSVMRDVTYSVDEHWLPMDCFVRITVGDRFMGSGWFVPRRHRMRVVHRRKGVSQRMEHSKPLHTARTTPSPATPVFWLYDRSQGGRPTIDEFLLSSRPSRRYWLCSSGSASISVCRWNASP
jgi:hypothetical protein